MPGRTVYLANGEFYHILNRGINRQPTFTDKREYKRALDAICFYSLNPPLKFSYFLKLSEKKRKETLNKLSAQDKRLVEVICYCLVPDRFHFLLKQKADDGIAKFMSNFQNSFTRYFNTRHQRIGPLFQGPFKAVRVETDEQLLHLSRYIHLNPCSSYIVKTPKALEKYQWSSFPEYLGQKEGFCQKKVILSSFTTPEDYQKFVYDQVAYQKEFQKIEHLILEENL